MADGLTGLWWDADAVRALPAYLQEARRPRRRNPVPAGAEAEAADDEELQRRTAPWAWLAGSPTPDDCGPPTMIMSRVIELPPQVALAAFHSWWSAQAQAQPAGAVLVGTTRLVLRAVDTVGGPLAICRVRGAVRFRRSWRNLRVEFDLAAWSSSRTELDLRPEARWPRRGRRRQYFRAAQALVDWMAGEMLMTAKATPPPRTGPGSDDRRPRQRHAA